jgi:hypothetical protein
MSLVHSRSLQQRLIIRHHRLHKARLPDDRFDAVPNSFDASAKCFSGFHNWHPEIFVEVFFGSGNKDRAVGLAPPMGRRFARVIIRSKRLARTSGGWADRDHAVVADVAGFEDHATV